MCFEETNHEQIQDPAALGAIASPENDDRRSGGSGRSTGATGRALLGQRQVPTHLQNASTLTVRHNCLTIDCED